MYDDHAACEACRTHVAACWCQPAEELDEYPELVGSVCPGGPGHIYLGKEVPVLVVVRPEGSA